jgi:hypothetical protein
MKQQVERETEMVSRGAVWMVRGSRGIAVWMVGFGQGVGRRLIGGEILLVSTKGFLGRVVVTGAGTISPAIISPIYFQKDEEESEVPPPLIDSFRT